MARNSKCQVCGYKFRKDDGDICPECLAPRDDVESCDDVHSHEEFENVTYVNEDVTFTQQPKPQIPPQPQNTYRPPITPSDIKIDYAKKKKNKSCATIAIVYVVIAVLVSVISMVAGFISAANSDHNSNRYPTVSTFSYNISIPEIDIPTLPDFSIPDILIPDIDLSSDYEYLGNMGIAFDLTMNGLTADYRLSDPKYVSSKDRVSVILIITNNGDEAITVSSADFAPELSTYNGNDGVYDNHPIITDSKTTTIEAGKSSTFKLEYDVENATNTRFIFNAMNYELDSDGNISGYYVAQLKFNG